MENSTICTEAPGKLILLGEYAVLEQAPCLVAAVNRSCKVQIDPQPGNVFRIEASSAEIPTFQFTLDDDNILLTSEIESSDKHKLRFVLSVIKHVAKQAKGQISGASIYIDTDNFYHTRTGHKLGLGASAAITVSLLSALMKYIGKPVQGEELYKQAFAAHRNAQENLGSGSDIAASAAGGVIQYRMGKDGMAVGGTIEPVEWPRDLQMISVWAGCPASTQSLVRKIKAYKASNRPTYDAIMNPMKQLSVYGCQSFKDHNIEEFLDVISDFVHQEKKLGEASQTDIVSEAHQKIADIINKAGGTYKPSGAGNGDMGVAFCSDMDTRRKIEDALGDSKFDVIDLTLQPDGMKMMEPQEAH